MDTNTFIAKYYPAAGDAKICDLKRWLAHVEKLIEAENTEPQKALANQDFLCKTFYISKTSGVSRPSYQKIKEFLLSLLDFYGVKTTIPARETVLASQEVTSFFPALAAVIALIDNAGEKKLDNYDPHIDLLHIKSIVVLGWYGLSLEEAASLKKNQIVKTGSGESKKHYISLKDNIEISETAFNILKRFSSTDEYRGFPGGKMISVISDLDYLFLPTRSDNDRIKAINLADILKRFNPSASDMGYAIYYRNLRKSALFKDVYEDKTTRKTCRNIMKYFGCNSTMAYGFEKEYNQWKAVCKL